jgi:streptogramin lyase
VATKVDVRGQPCGVVVAFDAVWVSVNDTAELLRIDPAKGVVTHRTKVSDKPCEITATKDSLWVVTQSGVVDRVDPATRKVVASVPTGFASYEAVAAFGSLWVSNRNGQSLTRVDPATTTTTTVDLPGVNAGGIAATADALWVGDDTTGSSAIARVDPTSLAVTKVEVGGNRPGYVASTGDRVWVSLVKSGTVTALDAASGAVVGRPTPAGSSPVNLAGSPDGRWVWVPDDATNLLTRIDATTGDAVERLEVGQGPAVVAPTDEGTWVTNFGDGSVWFVALAG